MTIVERIKLCDTGMIAAWENRQNDKRMEVRRSIFWTRREPNYLTAYYTHGVLIAGSNGLTLKEAAREVQCWLNRGGNE